ncbi:TPA: hypothetical protein H2W85_003847 [Salmonella enterica]|nr:hypothetical protein [Salmonella enterica]
MKIYNVKPLTLAILSGFLVFTTPSWSIVSQDGTEINATIKDGKFIFTGVTSGKGRCFFYPTPSQVEWTTDNALCQGVSTRPGQTPYDQGYPYIIIRALPSAWNPERRHLSPHHYEIMGLAGYSIQVRAKFIYL